MYSASNLFFFIGLMGSGKSYFGKAIATKLNFDFVDLDNLIEEKFNKSIEDLFKELGENGFRKIEYETLKNLIENNKSKTIIACGGGTPCFNNAVDLMNKNGITIWLNEETNVLVERLTNQTEFRPLIKNQSRFEIKKTLEKQFKQREKFYSKAKVHFHANQMNINNLINCIKNYE